MKVISLLLILLGAIACYGQPAGYENLVFEGGGARAFAYIGALKQLEVEGIDKEIRRVGGNSAGAIIALMVAVGYTPEEIGEVLREQQLQKFRDRHILFIGARHSLKDHYGWYNSRKVSRFLGQLIAAKTGDPDITFAELTNKGYKELRVMSLCVNKQQGVVLSAGSFPAMKVRDAVLISCSIPLIYHAVFVDSMGAIHKHQNKQGTFDIYIDGLIGNNYPIFMFDSINNDVGAAPARIANCRTLGIQVTSARQLANDKLRKGLVEQPVHRFSDYMEALFCYTLEGLNRAGMTTEDWDRTISLPTLGVSAQPKKISKQKIDALIAAGQNHTRLYLQAQRDKRN